MKRRTLRPALDTPEIYLYQEPVDFRKQVNGLAAIIERELQHNLFDGTLYLFCNRQRNKVKGLMWEDNGFVLYYKALAEEKFHWPKTAEEVITLSGEQINWLLDGYNLQAMQGHKELHYNTLF